MSRVARGLLRNGLVKENTGHTPSNIGRPRRILTPVPESRHVVGVKLTADTAYGVVSDLLGSVGTTAEVPLPAPVNGSVPVSDTMDVVARLIQRLAELVPTFDGIGISVGGTVTRRDVHRGVFLGWRDVPLADLVEAATGAPVVVTNDVTALAREQLWFGAGRTHSTFGVITVGAGLGFGVVREGHVLEQLVDDGHLLAHAPVTGSAGPRCDLGHSGCVASYLDLSTVARRVGTTSSPSSPETGHAIFTEGRVRDDGALALAHLVVTVAGAVQTERMVLAGEDVSHLVASPAFSRTLEDRLRDETGLPRIDLDISVEPSTFTDWARGAAVVGIQHILGAL